MDKKISLIDLAIKARAGEKDFLDKFLQRCYTEVYNSLHTIAMIHRVRDAEDIVQEVVIKIYRHLDTVRDLRKIRSWIFQLTLNAYRDRYRIYKMNATSAIKNADSIYDEKDECILEKRNFGFEPTDKSFQTSLIAFRIYKAMNTIPQEFSVPFYLCEIEDYQYDEVQAILDIPMGTVKSRIWRAREKIAKQLPDLKEDYLLGR